MARDNDVRVYAELAEEVRKAFNAEFFHPDTNQYDHGSQTANAMPLVLGLVEPLRRAAVLRNLVQDVRQHHNRVTAGDVGFVYVVRALGDSGRSDVVYDMVCQTDGPGYLYQLKKGATALAESWNADPAMSQNHCMLGHIEEWLFSGLGGIRSDPTVVGFKKIIIKPAVVGNLTWATVRYDSIRGRIVSSWKRDGDRFLLRVTIPPNNTATVFMPADNAGVMTESGRPVAQAKGVTFVRRANGATVYEIVSGTYNFLLSH